MSPMQLWPQTLAMYEAWLQFSLMVFTCWTTPCLPPISRCLL